MTKKDKLREKIMDPKRTKNITFEELQKFVLQIGYKFFSIKGDHHNYRYQDNSGKIYMPINIQPRKDGKAQPYQVRQVRDACTLLNK